jgi:hypothetical protein
MGSRLSNVSQKRFDLWVITRVGVLVEEHDRRGEV